MTGHFQAPLPPLPPQSLPAVYDPLSTAWFHGDDNEDEETLYQDMQDTPFPLLSEASQHVQSGSDLPPSSSSSPSVVSIDAMRSHVNSLVHLITCTISDANHCPLSVICGWALSTKFRREFKIDEHSYAAALIAFVTERHSDQLLYCPVLNVFKLTDQGRALTNTASSNCGSSSSSSSSSSHTEPLSGSDYNVDSKDSLIPPHPLHQRHILDVLAYIQRRMTEHNRGKCALSVVAQSTIAEKFRGEGGGGGGMALDEYQQMVRSEVVRQFAEQV
eukprot:gene34589-42667_t